MSWLLAGATCVAIGSSYLTLALVAETEPYENEEGEEDYTLSGYILLGGAYVIKQVIRLIFGHPKKAVKKNYDNVIVFNPRPVEDENDDDNELVV